MNVQLGSRIPVQAVVVEFKNFFLIQKIKKIGEENQ